VVIPLSFLIAALGLLIRTQFPGLVPDAAFATAVSALAPAGLRGLVGVGVLGAIMSSADTTLVSASTILSLNVVRPLRRLDDTAYLRVTRLFVLLIGAVAWAVAALQQEIIASLLLAYTVFVGGVALPTLASFWRRRLGVTPGGALAAVLVGGGTAILGELGDGAGLRAILGPDGTTVLSRVLGPEFASILPLVLSAAVLVLTRRRGRPRRAVSR